MTNKKNAHPGMAVDGAGGPVVDPSINVIALSAAANERQDDLRELTDRLNELRIKCQTEIGDLRAVHIKELGVIREAHQAQLARAESERLNAIRQVDREDVGKTAAQVLGQVQTLAATNNTTAETLRTQVATTAAAAQTTFQTAMSEVNKRLSALELSSSEGKGKQAFADPQIAEMVAEMKRVTNSLAIGGGKSAGLNAMWGYLVAAASLGGMIAMYLK